MFGTRRLAKRSIIGSQVSALWAEDGRYYTGIIQSTSQWPNGQEVYSVYLSDFKSTRTFQDTDLIGPGFQTINNAVLRHGQKVYITHNGRETTGVVISHDRECDDILITVDLPEGDRKEVIRKLEEIRLTESRKSSRLQHQDTDYSRMNEFQIEPKRRTVSHSIDVPLMKTPRRRRTYSSPGSFYEDEEDEYVDCESDVTDVNLEMKMDDNQTQEEVMDDTMAALVLTRLSGSPLSPPCIQLPDKFKFKDGFSPAPSSSHGSSGVWGMKSGSNSNTPSPPRYPCTASPPQFLSSSAPVSDFNFHKPALQARTPLDDGIDVEETSPFFVDEPNSRKRRASTRTLFKCTWPQCHEIKNCCNGIKKHVRQSHLGPRECTESEDSDESDNELDFYYTEIEVSVDSVTQRFAEMYTSSPPLSGALAPLDASGKAVFSDHDYQKKSMPMSIPSSRGHNERGNSHPASISSQGPKMPRSSSWQNSSKMAKSSHGVRGLSMSVSPKNAPMHKKPRSETKKCRKVYGMENRDLWCTQCKWKKACSRFLD